MATPSLPVYYTEPTTQKKIIPPARPPPEIRKPRCVQAAGVKDVNGVVNLCVGLNINPFLASAMEQDACARWIAEAQVRADASHGEMAPPAKPAKWHPQASNAIAPPSSKPLHMQQAGDYLIGPYQAEDTILAERMDCDVDLAALD